MKKNPLVKQISSRIHRHGLIAAQDIAEDTPIIEYVGKKLTQKAADKRAEEFGEDLVYFFTLNNRYVIDGDVDYNLAKNINHSCDPNCHTDVINGHIWIYASRAINEGEELTYDYGFSRPGWDERPCRCGSSQCFGFIVSREHWAAIRRTKRYQRLKPK